MLTTLYYVHPFIFGLLQNNKDFAHQRIAFRNFTIELRLMYLWLLL
jgi:hypothetical protein